MPASFEAPIDVGILTIRDDEFKAVLDVFPDDASVRRGRHREYAIRTGQAGQGARYRLAILKQVEQGNGEAQEAARDLIDDLQPSLLLVVGIAGGLPSDDITLGDVVLSTRIVDFSIEARKFEEPTTYNIGGGPITKVIASGVANLAARQDDLGEWWQGLPAKPQVSSGKKHLYGPMKWQQEVKAKLNAHFGSKAEQRPPIFTTGAIASSDRLVKDPLLLFPWITTARSLLAIEMESAGVHRATRDRTPMLAIRGLSDIVGLKRHDGWTKYACNSAAAFARAYLKTRPVDLKLISPRLGDEPTHQSVVSLGNQLTSEPAEEALANLIPLRHFPEKLFIAPATCTTVKQGWFLLRGKGKHQPQYVPGSWTLHEGRVYSLTDPEASRLSKIVDVGGVETHNTKDWAFSKDADRRRQFVHLLNAALRDDLWAQGVRYHGDSDAYAFMGLPDDPERIFKYQNLKVRSTVTVVSHYPGTTKAGKKFKTLRHVAFQGRFRLLGESWLLEITPTYRFTYDGKSQDRFHSQKLSTIKRFERNRSVVSQLLVWQAVLRAPWPRVDRPRQLEFAPLVRFAFSQSVSDGDLTPLEPQPVDLQPLVEETEE